MASQYRLTYTVNISYIGDGAGAESVPFAQTLQVNGNQQVLPIGGTLSATSISNATSLMATDVNTQFGAVLSQIQGFATGGN